MGGCCAKNKLSTSRTELYNNPTTTTRNSTNTTHNPTTTTHNPTTTTSQQDGGLDKKNTVEIPRESLRLTQKIGSGQFTEVWEGTWNNTTQVAVKFHGKLHPGALSEESAVLKGLCHENIVQLYAVCTDRLPNILVTEYMPGGSLLDYLLNVDLRLPSLIRMMVDVASGMAYLELQGYIHRDLRSRNVLVGQNGVCKVADFGLRPLVQWAYCITVNVDPIRWMAPEAMRKSLHSTKSDVWSFGIVMSEIITKGRMPYQGNEGTLGQLMVSIERGYRMPIMPGCPGPVYNIMLSCWDKYRDKRPTFDYLQGVLEEYFAYCFTSIVAK